MGLHKTFNDETHIPPSVIKRAQMIAAICAVLGLGASFGGYFMSHDTHVVEKAHADHHEGASHAKTEASKSETHAKADDHSQSAGHGESLKKQFLFSWLTAFVFFTTLCLGGLFFTILHHLVRASWSTSLRRIAENVAMNFPIMALCAAVLALLGFGEVFHWTHIDPAEDPIFKVKEPYLNINFFTIRTVFFFAIWMVMAFFFRGQSIKQDNTDGGVVAEALNYKMRKWAPLSMLTFALTLTFFAFDWLMSLDPHWFSTMFGVYIFAGTVVALFATLVVVIIWFDSNGVLKNTITIGNFHDAGKLMFGFIVFWTYITFCQYYLIWYANIPEEIGWYMHRSQGGWENIAMTIAVGHFILPFWMIMSRHTKRNKTVLGVAAVWMLVMHFIDLYFVVMPTYHHHLHFHWMDLTTFIGIGGLFLLGFLHWSSKDAIVAHKDPQLIASMEYDNV